MNKSIPMKPPGIFSVALVVAALGYFVDVYDLVLFLVVKNPSLSELGVSSEGMFEVGTELLNYQMLGMLTGGVVWGVLGDRVGRTKVLFGSILLYSIANILNAFVDTIPSYAILRFVAGFGLAGELGAGVTLVAELIPQHLRGYGTTIIGAVGVLGAIAAGLTGDLLPWRGAYLLGGGLGLLLLLLRVSVAESRLFEESRRERGSAVGIITLLSSPRRAIKFIMCILLGVPIWFTIGILLANARELARLLGVEGSPRAGLSIAVCYFGILLGDIVGGLMSQYLKSRKRPIAFFLFLSALLPYWLLSSQGWSLNELYGAYIALGFAAGYWVLVVTAAAEQFGTNIRSTVTTSVPNFIRGAVVPVSGVFLWLQPDFGLVNAALFVGLGVVLLASISLFFMEETFSRDLNFIER